MMVMGNCIMLSLGGSHLIAKSKYVSLYVYHITALSVTVVKDFYRTFT